MIEQKKESLNFLNKNITILEEISKKSLIDQDEDTHEFKGKKYYYNVHNGKKCVVIEIDAQGDAWRTVLESDILRG